MEPSLEIQKAIRSKLVALSALTAIVPAASIIDSNGRPSKFPSILIGEGQTVPDEGVSRTRHQVFTDLHIWTEEPGLVASKIIAGLIRSALADAVWNIPGLSVADLHLTSSRFMRDPDGAHAHGVISLSARVGEA